MLNKNSRFVFSCLRIAVYIVIAITIILLIENKMYFRCYFKENFNLLCPSCGATRATISIFKGDIMQAAKYNLIYTLAVFPIIMFMIIEDIIVIFLRLIKKTKASSLFETMFEIGEE